MCVSVYPILNYELGSEVFASSLLATVHCPQPVPHVPICWGSARLGSQFSTASHSTLPSLHAPAALPEARCTKLDPLLGLCVLAPAHSNLMHYNVRFFCVSVSDLCLWKRKVWSPILSRAALFPVTPPSLLVGHFHSSVYFLSPSIPDV